MREESSTPTELTDTETPLEVSLTSVPSYSFSRKALGAPRNLAEHRADLPSPPTGIVIAQNGNKRVQIQEWAQFLAYNELSLRAW